MAITPKEAAMLSSKEVRDLRVVERIIDQILRKNYDSEKNTVLVILPHQVPNRLKPVLLEIYEEAGWHISERDGYQRTGGTKFFLMAEEPVKTYMPVQEVKHEVISAESLNKRAASIDIGEDNVKASNNNTGKKKSNSRPNENVEI